MPNQVDLTRLDALYAAATEGKLRGVGGYLSHEKNTRISMTVEHIDEIGQQRPGSPYQAIPFGRFEDAKWHAEIHNVYPALRDEILALRERVASIEKATVEANTYWSATESELVGKLESAETTVAGLREALEAIKHEGHCGLSVSAEAWEAVYPGMPRKCTCILSVVQSALAATPAQHEARIRERVLYEAAGRIGDEGALNAAYHALRLERMAEEAAKEAGNV